MGGSTKQINTTPDDIRPLRAGVANWLMGPSANAGAGGLNWGTPASAGTAPNQGMYGPQGQMAQPQPWMNGGPGNGYMGPPGQGSPMVEQYKSQMQGGSATQMSMPGAGAGYMGGGRPGDGGQTNSQGMPLSWMAGGGSVGPSMAGPQMGTGGGGMGGGQDYYPPQGPLPNGGMPPQQQGGGATGFNRVNNQQMPGGPVQVARDQGVPMPQQFNSQQVGLDQMMFGQQMDPSKIPQVNAQQLNPSSYDPRGAFNPVGTQFGQGLPPQFQRGDVRDATGQSSGYSGTQSVDQLGGANSAFFRNMQGQLQPSFAQGRSEALAAAKEGLGNMGAGSAVGNALGTAMNRSLGNEQATLANYATQGLNTEVGRQLQDASMGAQVGMANANRNLSAQQGNQQADMGFLSQLLGQGAQGLQAQGMGLQGQMANQGMQGQLGMANAQNQLAAGQSNQNANLTGQQSNANNFMQLAGLNQATGQGNMMANLNRLQGNQQAGNQVGMQNIANTMNSQQFNSGQNQQTNNLNAQLGQAYQQLSAQMGDANAQRFMQMLLGMSTGGVGPNEVVQSGGLGGLIPGLGSALGTAAGAYFGAKGKGK